MSEEKPEITNEMKRECIGDFNLTTNHSCVACFNELFEYPEECPQCGGEVEYTETREIPWDTMKDIYKKMYKYSPVPETITHLTKRVEELEDEKARLKIQTQHAADVASEWFRVLNEIAHCYAMDARVLRRKAKDAIKPKGKRL